MCLLTRDCCTGGGICLVGTKSERMQQRTTAPLRDRTPTRPHFGRPQLPLAAPRRSKWPPIGQPQRRVVPLVVCLLNTPCSACLLAQPNRSCFISNLPHPAATRRPCMHPATAARACVLPSAPFFLLPACLKTNPCLLIPCTLVCAGTVSRASRPGRVAVGATDRTVCTRYVCAATAATVGKPCRCSPPCLAASPSPRSRAQSPSRSSRGRETPRGRGCSPFRSWRRCVRVRVRVRV